MRPRRRLYLPHPRRRCGGPSIEPRGRRRRRRRAAAPVLPRRRWM